ncbi:MAG: 1-deoxy-D-xylulose-5-phosphate reductoisomerase [Bacilli bacterium]|jgi:1-deoxy-D-xylulose-5-phosphate reductoisomerase|nr:1-deoxy-D-xylulose-5-phosphate reductoisomerase [Bacilli bacterium]NLN79988.1 1-deoxy-D-xylulose-5-phosphate reductoisomerase [Erysipelotrichia bacterium]
MKKVMIFGASGSIGEQTLDVLSIHQDKFELVAFSVGQKIEMVSKILRRHPKVTHVCIKHKEYVSVLKKQYPHIIFFSGDEGLLKLIKHVEVDLVVNALVGFVGFRPTITALKKGLTLCLANKESLVIGGEIINNLLLKGYGKLYPIDSEHVALAKCLNKVKEENVKRLILTASGGAFRKHTYDQLKNVKAKDALKHPTWQMGAKITIDSATMMNKGFEIIEAYYLFNYPLDKIDILMHDESHVHSLVQLKDDSYIADVSKPNMRDPITYALFEGQVKYQLTKVANLKQFKEYHFGEFDKNKYPCVGLAKKALQMGGTAPAIINAANEMAVYAFLDNKIAFLDIAQIIKKRLNQTKIRKQTIRNVLNADAKTRAYLRKRIR